MRAIAEMPGSASLLEKDSGIARTFCPQMPAFIVAYLLHFSRITCYRGQFFLQAFPVLNRDQKLQFLILIIGYNFLKKINTIPRLFDRAAVSYYYHDISFKILPVVFPADLSL